MNSLDLNVRYTFIARWCFLTITLFAFAGNVFGQIVTETLRIDIEDAPIESQIVHIERDAIGYFYIVGFKQISRFDGEKIEPVDYDILSKNGLGLLDIIDLQKASDGSLILISIDPEYSYRIEPSSLRLSRIKDPIPIISLHRRYNFDFSVLTADSMVIINKKIKTVLGADRIKVYQDDSLLLEKDLSHDYGEIIFANSDKVGNIIIGLDTELDNHIDHILILDTLLNLHDYSDIALNYADRAPEGQGNKGIQDIYAENFFNSVIVVGCTSLQVVKFKNKGISSFLNEDFTSSSIFGTLISGITRVEDVVYFTTQSGFNYSCDLHDSLEMINDFGEYSLGARYIGQSKLGINQGTILQRALYGVNKSSLIEINVFDRTSDVHYFDQELGDFFVLPNDLILLGFRDAETQKGGIRLYDMKSRSVRKTISDLAGVRSLYYDELTDRYWIGTRSGLLVFDKDWNLLAEFSKNFEEAKDNSIIRAAISHDDISTIVRQTDKLWAGSLGGGVYQIDPVTLELKHTLQSDLTDNRVLGMITDQSNNLWVSTFNGLNVIAVNGRIIRRLYYGDGLPSREFNLQAVARGMGDELYFGTINGICRINTKDVLSSRESKKVTLTGIRVYSDNLESSYSIPPENKIYETSDSLVFDLSVLDFPNTDKRNPLFFASVNQENVNVSIDKNRIIVKNYMEGELIITYGLSSTTSFQTIAVNIQKDYRDLLKILGVLLTSIIIMGFAFYLRFRQVRKRETEKAEINQRIAELRLSALQGQMNPHFIFNALGSIQYFIQANDKEKADDYLSDFAILIRKILDSSDSSWISLDEELEILKLYFKLETMRFEDKFDIQLNVDDKLDLQNPIPPMIIQPFVENAINHGLLHLIDHRGKLTVSFKKVTADETHIEITDNGIGREASQKLYETRKHNSKGLTLVNERVKVLQKTSDSRISIHVADVELAGIPAGTKVEIRVKTSITT